MIKILAVGNSFSQDATAHIEMLDDSIFVRNLYIGGCSLETHAELLKTDKKQYEYQQNGEACVPGRVSLGEALSFEAWDYITVQQASGLSGKKESYHPYIDELIAYIKGGADAEIVFHQTWAYEKNSAHDNFADYGSSQIKMRERIKEASESVADELGLRVIPSGKTIGKLREYDFFDIEKGGISLCRDGFHMSLSYGRCATASTWIKFFTGKLPGYLKREDLSEGYKIIKEVLERD